MFAKIAAKIIVSIVLILLVLSATLLFALNQPRFITDTSLYFLKKSSSNIIFKEITIDKVHWFSWQGVHLQNVRIKCKIKGVSYFFSTGEMTIDHLTALINKTPMNVEIKSLALVSDRLNVSDIHLQGQIYFKMFHYDYLQGALAASQINWGQYLFEGFKGNFNDQNRRFSFSDAQAKVYGGSIEAKGWFKYSNRLSYNVNVQFINVNSALIAQVNPNFEQVTALINGTIIIKDYKKKGFLIESDLHAPLGGSMKASLLRYLAKYVPQRQQVEDLIQKDADVTLSKIQAKVTSIDKEKIISEVILNSSSLNLNMDVKFDIHVEGGIKALFEYVHQ
jgi:hypothetical protein